MVIVTADDLGRSAAVSRAILESWDEELITTAAFMVFMDDSVAAARSARETGLECGLHLNFTLPFDGNATKDAVEAQERVARFLTRSKLHPLLWNPFLAKDFDLVIRTQFEEYHRIFGREPVYVNGHHHMHLCTGVMTGSHLPAGIRVRRSFSFLKGEKGPVNRAYREALSRRVAARHGTTDMFVSIRQLERADVVDSVVEHGRDGIVEVMVHPDDDVERALLGGPEVARILRECRAGCFAEVPVPDFKRESDDMGATRKK